MNKYYLRISHGKCYLCTTAHDKQFECKSIFSGIRLCLQMNEAIERYCAVENLTETYNGRGENE
jgi:hypothetical protein